MGVGTCLLNFTLELTQELGAKSIHLSDMSFVKCETTHEEIDFPLARFLTTGKTWYESKGFRLESQKMQAELDHLNNKIGNMNAAEVQALLPISLQRHLPEAIRTQNAQTYLSHLWSTQCSYFSEILLPFYKAIKTKGINPFSGMWRYQILK
jgi:hypothetical protein